MNLINGYSVILLSSRISGFTPFQIKTINGKKVLYGSNIFFVYSVIISIFYLVWHIYGMSYVGVEIMRQESWWARGFSFFGSAGGSIHYTIIVPIILLKHRKTLCVIQNRLNELFIKVVNDKRQTIKNLSNLNNFCHYSLLTLVSIMCLYEAFKENTEWMTIDFVTNVLMAASGIPIIYVKFTPILLFLALVNIFKLFYSSINNTLKNESTESKVVTIRECRKLENTLKELFDDLCSIFSFTLFGFYAIAFALVVTGVVISISEKSEFVSTGFVAWVIVNYILAIAVIACVCLLTSEVRQSAKSDTLKIIKKFIKNVIVKEDLFHP